MRLLHEEFTHPTQASAVGLSVFEHPEGGYLLTEQRRGTVTVFATLGLFDTRETAAARLRARAAELSVQGYRDVAA